MGMTINVQEAVGDLTKYDVATRSRFAKSIATVAQLMSGHQKNTLLRKVKDRTPILETSVSPDKKDRFNWEIGPDANKVVYANYIEYGLGTFKGYHYVRDSITRYRREFVARIKQDIERPV